MSVYNENDDYCLEQVVVLSRHGIRSPLLNTLNILKSVTHKTWPDLHCPPGYLTGKGGVLESYFGHYFALWLAKHNLVFKAQQPNSKQIDIYANSMQRTVATAQYFTLGAFAGFDIPVRHKYPIERMDPLFNPVIRDISEPFYQQALDAIHVTAGEKEGLAALNRQLKPAYHLLEAILDYPQSTYYFSQQADFFDIPSELALLLGEEPMISGPINIGTAVADAFTLQYYEGLPLNEVAWGKIDSTEQWQMITEIKNQFLNILFASPTVAAHIAAPLVDKIYQTLNNGISQENIPEFTLLVGHDSNIVSVLQALNVKKYHLPGQLESTPIGGKVVFQRWRDKRDDRQLFKMEYVYQSFEQIRQAQKLDLAHPPQHVLLELADLKRDKNSFYQWDDVKSMINNMVL